MVVARASGALIASSLKQNAFLTLEPRPGAPFGDVEAGRRVPRGCGGPILRGSIDALKRKRTSVGFEWWSRELLGRS